MKKIIYCLILVLLLAGILIYNYFNKKEDNYVNINTPTINYDDIKWDDIESTSITFDDNNVTGDNNGYVVSDNYITIKAGGSYYLSGIYNGYINIDSESEVYLILDNLNINSSSNPAINIINAKKVYLKLEDGSINNLIDNNTNEEANATIYSKDDLIISGNGTLNITANNHGIVSKDTLQIISGNINIDAQNDGIRAKDYVAIKSGNFNIRTSSDGIKATNDTDNTLGYVVIDGGTFNIEVASDAIQAVTNVVITNGDITIKTGNGYTKTSKTMDFNMWSNTTSNDESKKGIKADSLIQITGGKFDLNTEDDAIHSNGDLVITAGNYTIKSSDDAIHADGMATIESGTFDITASEGIEATYVKINNGNINISATDDGINAGNKSKAYTTTIEINGGEITINMASGDTDGIDSNGNLYINGGTISINCNSPFDYDGKAEYNGGTLIVNGTKTTSLTNQFGGQTGQPGQRPNMNRMR